MRITTVLSEARPGVIGGEAGQLWGKYLVVRRNGEDHVYAVHGCPDHGILARAYCPEFVEQGCMAIDDVRLGFQDGILGGGYVRFAPGGKAEISEGTVTYGGEEPLEVRQELARCLQEQLGGDWRVRHRQL